MRRCWRWRFWRGGMRDCARSWCSSGRIRRRRGWRGSCLSVHGARTRGTAYRRKLYRGEMARSVDDQFAELDALKRAPVNDATIVQLRKALENKTNFVVARAASVASTLNVVGNLKSEMEA